MDIEKKYDQFFEQVKDKPLSLTATAIMNAVRANGYAPELAPFYLAIAKASGADIKAEMADLTQAHETARQEKTICETMASLAEKSGAFPSEADPEKRKALYEDIQRIYETLKKTVTTEPKIISSRDLMATQFPPKQWIVEPLIGPGLTILSGASKIGKSWLLFALAEAASLGGNFLGRYKVNKTSVLHLSLEDTLPSIKERREILAGKQGGFSGNDNLFITTEWETGPGGLENYLRTHNEIKLVIIDTLGRFMPDIEDMNEYAPAVKALAGIKKIADNLNIAILVVHHAKKGSGRGADQGDWMDQSLGSTGIVASADTVILLSRDIETQKVPYKKADGNTGYKTISTGNRLNTGKLYATRRGIKDTFHNVEYSPSFGMWAVIDKKKAEAQGKGKNTENQPGMSGALGEDTENPLLQEWK